jgi:hypothetical protein
MKLDNCAKEFVRDLGQHSVFSSSRDLPDQVSISGSRRGLKKGGHALEKGAQGRGGLGWSFNHHATVLLAADLKL